MTEAGSTFCERSLIKKADMPPRFDLPAEVVWRADAILGEGPVWDDRTGSLYWLDIKGKQLHAYTPSDQSCRTIALSVEVGAIAPRSKGGMIAATRRGFATLNPEDGSLAFLADPEDHLPDNRFNDGKCDTCGNFVAGSMDDREINTSGAVYHFDPGHRVSTLFEGYVVCNGPAFSIDGRILYFSNSVDREILAFPYDPVLGQTGKPRVFARIPENQGHPDGLTVDSKGYLWCAHWGGGQLTCFDPQGFVAGTIRVPVPLVTSCTFGGLDYDRLFITTARVGLSAAQLEEFPLSGSLFMAEPGVTGLPAAKFSG